MEARKSAPISCLEPVSKLASKTKNSVYGTGYRRCILLKEGPRLFDRENEMSSLQPRLPEEKSKVQLQYLVSKDSQDQPLSCLSVLHFVDHGHSTLSSSREQTGKQ